MEEQGCRRGEQQLVFIVTNVVPRRLQQEGTARQKDKGGVGEGWNEMEAVE